MIQCQGCTCAGWLWEGEGGLGDHQPGVYVPLKALFQLNLIFQMLLRNEMKSELALEFWKDIRKNVNEEKGGFNGLSKTWFIS